MSGALYTAPEGKPPTFLVAALKLKFQCLFSKEFF